MAALGLMFACGFRGMLTLMNGRELMQFKRDMRASCSQKIPLTDFGSKQGKGRHIAVPHGWSEPK